MSARTSDPPPLPQRPRRGPRPVTALAGLLWPAACAGCGAPDQRLCPACSGPLRERGGRSAALAGTTAPGAPPVWAATAYHGPVRAAVVAWKDRGRADLDRWLVPALVEAVLAALEQSERLGAVAEGPPRPPSPGRSSRPAGRGASAVLVPVPSRPAALRERGRDAVGDLTRAAASRLRRRGVAVVVAPVLVTGRSGRDQVGLDARSRADNAASSLHLRAGRSVLPPGAAVVLVDDVVTTGSTLAEAARVLRRAGVPPVAAAAVAATQRRGAPG